MTPGMTRGSTSSLLTLPSWWCAIPEIRVVTISAVCTEALMMAGANPMATSSEVEDTP